MDHHMIDVSGCKRVFLHPSWKGFFSPCWLPPYVRGGVPGMAGASKLWLAAPATAFISSGVRRIAARIYYCARAPTRSTSPISAWYRRLACIGWVVSSAGGPVHAVACVRVMHGSASARTTYVFLYACVACGSASELSIYLVSPFCWIIRQIPN
jgi:hypothetical protein